MASRGLGIDALRTGQREAVEGALEGRDVLAVMPTGYGKSAIYQLVAAAVDGPTVVVSPLIALQRDQVEALAGEAVGEAAQANSTLRPSERDAAFGRLRDGRLEFLFLAPEQLAKDDTVAALAEAGVSLFVVDEAHCISSWGHDFRPDYLRLGDVIDGLGHPTVIALTATAAPPVRKEIADRLHLRDPKVVVHGFDRPNIHLAVEVFPDGAEKDARLLNQTLVLAAGGRSGIVYVTTRRRTEELAELLSREGPRAEAYHGGLPRRRREEVQEGFMDGDVRIVVATTAFGMGIDKADVRFVLHGDVTESIDEYYQEIGRAGRDGEPAEACLFFHASDLGLRRFLGSTATVDEDDLVDVATAVAQAGDGGVPVDRLAEDLALNPRGLTMALHRLEDAGAVALNGDDVARPAAGAPEPEAAARRALDIEDDRKQLEASRFEMMRAYAETRGCRRRFLLTYFGERYDGDCGFCDNCESGASAAAH
ncbi:MAG TPA: ATP-dependent DNA helicase RecQ, partial [Acidimicrobiales bacterium]|nr:ATP-dependent DNA helicase RecQ [Acidimicrobiales bacterium]